jgi:hypothetical protein
MPDFDGDHAETSSAPPAPTCKHAGTADDCTHLCRILEADEELPEHPPCPDVCAASVAAFMEEPFVYRGDSSERIGEQIDISRPLGDGSYAFGWLELCPHPLPNDPRMTRFKLLRTHPYPYVTVTGRHAKLYLVIRQAARSAIAPEGRQRRNDILTSGQWRAVRDDLAKRYSVERREWIDWPLKHVPSLAASLLQGHGLPPDLAYQMVAEVDGSDPSDEHEPLAFAMVTTFLMYEPDRPEWTDIVQTRGFSAMYGDEGLRAAADRVAQCHLRFVGAAFPNVHRISGRHQATSKYGSLPRDVAAMIAKFKQDPSRQKWDTMRRNVVAWGDAKEGSGINLWDSVRVSLHRAGFVRKSLKS